MRRRGPSKALRGKLLTAKHADWRRKAAKRQDGNCYWCGKHMREPTLDHLIPLARDGEDHWENVVAAHRWCNEAKGDLMPEDFAEPGSYVPTRATTERLLSPRDEKKNDPTQETEAS